MGLLSLFGIKKNNVIKYGEYDKKTFILTLTYENGDEKEYYTKYGYGITWSTLPMMEDVNSTTKLNQIYKYIEQHGNPYPIAHKKKV